MSRLSTETENSIFIFETVLRVRHSEVDIGQNLTIEAITCLLSEARSRFLYAKAIKEAIGEFQGLVTTNIVINILSYARIREELLFEVGVENLHNHGGDFIFKVTRMSDGSPIANALMKFATYDYRQNKIIPMNTALREAFRQKIS